MPTPKKGPRLGGSPAHQRLIVSNLATALFEHGRITTTEAKARVLRPVAEKLITKAKRGDLHNRREVLKTIRDKSVVHTLFTEIAPTLRGAPGWLHPDHQDRPPQGRQRPDGGHRAGDRGLRAEAGQAAKKAAKEAPAKKAPAAEEAPVEETATDEAVEAPTEDAAAEEAPAEVADEAVVEEEAPAEDTTDESAEESDASDKA